MKSKTSFFNKTIFLKNVTLYWPLWAIYTLGLLIMLPFMLWMDFYNAQFYEYSQAYYEQDVISCVQFEPFVIWIAIASVVFGMAVFNYMYNSKSSNMIHSLPVNKTELFGTNVISGLVFLIVPQIFSFVLSVFVCLAYGVTCVEYLGMWMLLAMGTAFVAYAFVVFCAMFTGLMIAVPVYVIIVNFLSYWIYYMVYSVVSIFGYGVNYLGDLVNNLAEMLCPLFCFYNNIGIDTVHEDGVLKGAEFRDVNILLIYMLAALVLYVIAYMTYKKRHIETAGDLISVNWLKPVFRWGVGISGGIFGSILVRNVARELGFKYSLPVFIIFMLILGMLAYFIADMFVRKTFRVFKKKNLLGCSAFSAVLLVCFFGLYGLADMYEGYVPKEDEIENAKISMGYEIQLDGEDAKEVLELHKKILEYADVCEEIENRGYYNEGNEYISIYYHLKNGDFVARDYLIPYEIESMAAVIQQVKEIEKQPDLFLKNEICERYDEVTEFGTGWLQAMFADSIYDSKSLTQEQVEKLYAAILADAQNGTLIKYNVYSNWAYEETLKLGVSITATLELEYRDPDMEYGSSMNAYGEYVDYVEDYASWDTLYIEFGQDCQNIINTLIDCGIIESADDLYWGENITME